MHKILIPLLLLRGVLCAQTSGFPTTLDGDPFFKVAKNGIQTTLKTTAQASDNVLVVQSTTGIAANMLMTIDSEIVNVCGVSGANIVQIGIASCPNADGRGFDGTTPAAHLQGKTVSNFVAAWYHNALKNALKVMEASLQVVGANAPTSGSGAPANPCTAPAAQYVDTTAHTLYFCGSNGGDWVGPVSSLGVPINPLSGGTGVNNGTNTLTLSGNTTFSGAFNPTFVIPSSSSWTFQSGGGTVGNALTANPLSQFASTTSAQLLGTLSNPTGTGFAVFSASPTFTGTVILPSPFTLGATSVTATGTQINYLSAATGTTGTTSTNVVFSTSPVLTTPNLGTPSALVLTNATALPCGALPALTGDTTTSLGSCATTTVKINGTSLAGLATGIVKNTTATGVPSIAASSDVISTFTGTCNNTTFLRADGSCQSAGGGSPALSSLIAAAGANSFNSGDNAQVWNWSLTTASKSAFTFGENVASVSAGTPFLVNIQTLAGSTLNPLQVTAVGTSNGVRVNTTGQLSKIGTGSVNADALNGTAFSGTNGDLVAYGAANVPVDTGFLATNVVRKDAAATLGAFAYDFSASSVPGFRIPVTAGAVPALDGNVSNNSTNHTFVWGSNGTTMVGAIAATGTGTATTCSNQFVSAVSSLAIPTCTTATLAGAQFANQGTTTTVLHGNAAGNPSFGAVGISDVSASTGTGNFVFSSNPTFAGNVNFNAMISPNAGSASAGYLIGNAGSAIYRDNGTGNMEFVFQAATLAEFNAASSTTTGVQFDGLVKFAGQNTTAAVSGVIGTTCPAVTCTAAYTWVRAVSSDGSTVYFPVWK